MTPTTQAIGRTTLAQKVAMVLAGTVVIAISAQIAVPFFPVPMTLQTAAVLAVGMVLGARLGALTVVAYLAEGAMGLPVFAGFRSTAALAGPTAGFLVGFVGMAWLAGLATDRGLRHPAALAGVALAASALLYVPGLLWPLAVAPLAGIEAGWAGMAPGATLAAFATPYLLGDAVKAVLVALAVSGGMVALGRRRT